MVYQEKYLKYKSKYLALKNKYFGGTAEENNEFLLHGTSLFYIDDIKVYGLTGQYNQEIYSIIQKYWKNIRHLAKDPYVEYFIERQKNKTEKETISLSFTGHETVAREYSDGARQFGEGPSRFLIALKEYIHQNKESITQDVIEDCNFLDDASQYPGIILAINKNDFPKIQHLEIKDLNQWEHTLHFLIPPDRLYIRRNANDYILLLSEQGKHYTDKLKSDFLKNKRIKFEENERIKLLEGWEIKIDKGPTIFRYTISKKNGTMYIKAQYDINNEVEFPHYLQINVGNSDIYINFVIKNILGTTEYETRINSMEGIDLFKSNCEFKEKLKLAIDGVMTFIPEERKEKIFKKVLEIMSL